MNGNPGGDQGHDQSHLSYLLNAAGGGQGALMGYHGAGAGLRYGVSDATLEEQILQRASALRAEALMQQQQQQQAQQRQHQLGAALAALQQQQQLGALAGLNPNFAALSGSEQEALLNRAAALRELGIAGAQGGGMDRLQQFELGRYEELERRRQQLAALANLPGNGRPDLQGELQQQSQQEAMGQDSHRSETQAAPDKAPSTNTGSGEKSKEDLRKTPGTVIVPCRARGMPMDHNFKTAYFVISEDAKHGEDLVCSYFACRNGGVKFRYCAHCMAPVAKRNFCRRHDHGMSAKTGEPPKDDDDEESVDHSEEATPKPEPPPPPPKKVIEKPVMEKPPIKPPSMDIVRSVAPSVSPVPREEKKPETKSAKRKKPAVEDLDDEDDPALAELASISSKRRKMWSALLIKRPRTKDPRHLSSWLNEVLTVSDFETPFESGEGEVNGATPESIKRQKVEAPQEEKAQPAKKERKSSADKEKKKKKSESKSAEDHGAPPKAKNETGKDKEKAQKNKESTKAEKKERVEGKSKSKKDSVVRKEDKMSKESAKNAIGDKRNSDSFSEGKSPKKSDSSPKKGGEDGFVGSFADWRDRKKEKALKKGTNSLKK